MHVLLLPSWYKTPDEPNVGTFFEEQARMLMRLKYKVGILYSSIDMSFSSRWKTRGRFPASINDNNLHTFYSFSKSIVPRSRDINFWYVAYKAEKVFCAYIKAHGMPDVLHAHSVFYGGIVAAYLSKKYSVPYILTEHYTGLILDDIRNIPASYRQVRRIFDLSSANFVVSSDFKRKLCELYELQIDKISVLHNVINPIFFSYMPPPVKFPFVFIVNGFLTEKKNHYLLFESFKIVRKKYNCLLYIVGDGKLRLDLEYAAAELRIDKYVTFCGNVDRLTVKEFLAKSHVLVSTSVFETFGVGIAEALACGRPVVVTNSGGPTDFVKPYNGIIVEQHTKESFSEAMIELINSYESYDQPYISERCREDLSEKAIGSILDKAYQRLFIRSA